MLNKRAVPDFFGGFPRPTLVAREVAARLCSDT